MDQTDTNLDLELLAALADGRLSGEERERAVKMLATSDDALEIFASTVREPRESVDVIPIVKARRWRQWQVIAPIAAAAAIAFVALPKLLAPNGRVVPATQLAMQVAAAPRFGDAVRAGWDEHRWAVNRGVGSSGPAAVGSEVESKLAFRLGVRTVDVVVALRVPDTALAGRLTGDIAETLKSVDLAQSVAARYAELRSRISTDSRDQSIERATEIETELRDLLRSPAFVLGQWAEAADLAAQAHEASFFSSKEGMRYIKSAIPAGKLAADDAEAIRRVDARLTEHHDEQMFEEVHAVLQQLIQRRGS